MPDTTDLAIARGIPLAEEPGLGPLTLPGFLAEVTARFAQREALVEHLPDGMIERWSYTDLQAQAMAVARALVACGVGKDSRIGVLMTNRLEWIASCFGIALAGGTVVGLSTFSTAEELDYLIRAADVEILLFEQQVANKDFAAILTQLEPVIGSLSPGELRSLRYPYLRRLVATNDPDATAGGVIESWDGFLGRGQTVSPALVNARAQSVTSADPALLFFSSGSTAQGHPQRPSRGLHPVLALCAKLRLRSSGADLVCQRHVLVGQFRARAWRDARRRRDSPLTAQVRPGRGH
jgi:fatty-acyl-CoA synthase